MLEQHRRVGAAGRDGGGGAGGQCLQQCVHGLGWHWDHPWRPSQGLDQHQDHTHTPLFVHWDPPVTVGDCHQDPLHPPDHALGALWLLLQGLAPRGTRSPPATPAGHPLSPGISLLGCKPTGSPRPRVQGTAPGPPVQKAARRPHCIPLAIRQDPRPCAHSPDGCKDRDRGHGPGIGPGTGGGAGRCLQVAAEPRSAPRAPGLRRAAGPGHGERPRERDGNGNGPGGREGSPGNERVRARVVMGGSR